MADKINLSNTEKQMYNWWSKIRWFMVLVLFAIGILQVGQTQQNVPITIFVITFVGICILNVLYHLQMIGTNNLIRAVQIILDAVFATLVVHLTGGIESSFVWIYLIAVITASLSIEKSGGFISAMIGSMCLLTLILMYNFRWLVPIEGTSFNTSIPAQTIFLISYTGLFSGISFMSSFISNMIKKISLLATERQKGFEKQKNKLLEEQQLILEDKKKIDEYKKVTEVAASIASIDHDLNNPLSVISLSISRVKKAAMEYNDEKLSRSSDQMTESINKISGILIRLQGLKRLNLIKKESEKHPLPSLQIGKSTEKI